MWGESESTGRTVTIRKHDGETYFTLKHEHEYFSGSYYDATSLTLQCTGSYWIVIDGMIDSGSTLGLIDIIGLIPIPGL